MYKYATIEETITELIEKDFQLSNVVRLLDSYNDPLFNLTLDAKTNVDVVLDLLGYPVDNELDIKNYFSREQYYLMYDGFLSDIENNTPDQIDEFISKLKELVNEIKIKK